MQIADAVGTISHGDRPQNAGAVVCHPVILRRNDTEALLIKRDGRSLVPGIEIPRWQRLAPHLVSQVQKMWEIEAICRFSLSIEDIEARPRFVVLDALDSSRPALNRTAWVPVDDILWENSEPLNTRDGFYAALRQGTTYATAKPPIPFTGPGWFEEVADWTESHLNGLKLRGRWMQYNMGPAFSLIRYETNGLPVWFKAVGEPNLQEYGIALELSKLRSPHVPQLLAVHSGWHAWLMLDGNGQPLDETAEIEQWMMAARSLAELQIESVPARESLLAAGCKDLRLQELRLRIESFMNVVERLMEMQPATPPRILSRDDLCFIEFRLRRAINELESLGMPDTIGHSDLNPGNILVSKGGAVFLDWMQGHIGHPVVTFEYLLALLGRLLPDREDWQQKLRKAYFDAWRSVSSETQMMLALQLTPLIAPFAFAMSCCSEWNEDTQDMNPNLQKFTRTLTRRMFAAARKLA